MKTFYIKFRHSNDVYAIDPDYDLSPDDFIPPKVCSRCGENLYIPVELPDNITINQPLSINIGSFHSLFRLNQPEFITMGFISKDELDYEEKRRLNSFYSVSCINDYSWEMLIDDWDIKPVNHRCENV